ncbi:MAG: qbdA, partial [Phenylobacterium sp.]|nr:qbdA [Phenylobacterium sp.]
MALAAAGAALLLVAGCHRGGDGAAVDPADWPAFGRTPGAQDYSPLTAINAANVRKLGLAWSYDLEPAQNMTAPVEADGVVYVSNGQSIVTALEAASGKLLWRYDPQVGQVAGAKLRRAWGSRGLAFDDGRVFVGTQDGRLIALDAKTGKLDW